LLVNFASETAAERARRFKPFRPAWASSKSSVSEQLATVHSIATAQNGTRLLSPKQAADLKFINQDPSIEGDLATTATRSKEGRSQQPSSLSIDDLTLATVNEAGVLSRISLDEASESLRVVVCASRLSRRGAAKLIDSEILSKHRQQLAFTHAAVRVLQGLHSGAPEIKTAFIKELGSLLDDGSWDRRESIRNTIKTMYESLSLSLSLSLCPSHFSVFMPMM